MNAISYDQVCAVLQNAPNVKFSKPEGTFFNRMLHFEIRGVKYHIEWWKNHSFFFFGDEAKFIFQHMEVSGTWPNSYKLNLQFYNIKQNGDRDAIAVVPLQTYKEAKESEAK